MNIIKEDIFLYIFNWDNLVIYNLIIILRIKES